MSHFKCARIKDFRAATMNLYFHFFISYHIIVLIFQDEKLNEFSYASSRNPFLPVSPIRIIYKKVEKNFLVRKNYF